jgi:hypothetical protein
LTGTPSLALTKDCDDTPITAGITLTVDFGSITGRNHVAIDLSSDEAYSNGLAFHLYVAAGSEDGVSVVGYEVTTFSIRHRSALMRTEPDRTLSIRGRIRRSPAAASPGAGTLEGSESCSRGPLLASVHDRSRGPFSQRCFNFRWAASIMTMLLNWCKR